MSPADEVRRLLDEILQLKAARQKADEAHQQEVARLEAILLHDQADIAKLETLKTEAEARTAEAEERSDRNEHHAGELRRILAKDQAIAAAKGMIAEREGLDDVEAFAMLRARARRARKTLGDYSTELLADHDKAVARPGNAGAPTKPARPSLPGRGANNPKQWVWPANTHADCVLCAGKNTAEGRACRRYHDLIEIRDAVTLNGAIFE